MNALKGLFAFLLIAFVATGAMAYGGWQSEDVQETLDREQYREERQASRGEMQAALEAHDYEAWSELITATGRPQYDTFTEDDFDKLIEIHEAKMAGDLDLFEQLRAELGLEAGFGHGMKGYGMGGQGMHDGSGPHGMGGQGYDGECPYQ